MQNLSSLDLTIQLKTELKIRSEGLKKTLGRPPGLAVILVGQNPASQVYVKNKVKACEEVGITSFHHELPEITTFNQLKLLIEDLNSDPRVDGILLQLPLPKHLDSDAAMELIAPQKDPDGLTAYNQGLLAKGHPLVSPCTPAGVIEILKFFKVPIAGKHAVVVGRSSIVGKPMAQLLLLEDATVTIAHSKTKNLSETCRQADILVVAAGKPALIGKDDVKKGAVVIDIGVHRGTDGKLSGDVRMSELNEIAAGCTPVPGGVGPMTIVMLLTNTLRLAEAQKI